MRKFHLHLLCVLLLSFGTVQPSNVAIMKVKSNPKSLCLRGKISELKLLQEDKHSIKFNVKLHLEFINTSSKPFIILWREFWVGRRTLARSVTDAAAYKYIYLSDFWPSVSGASEWKELRQRLNQPSPPSDLTRILAPGESLPYEADVTLYIEKAGSFDKTSQSWETIKQTSPVWLQVTLETWAINIEPHVDPNNPEFGKVLQQRWRQFGELQLERLTSEPMPLDFSTLILNSHSR